MSALALVASVALSNFNQRLVSRNVLIDHLSGPRTAIGAVCVFFSDIIATLANLSFEQGMPIRNSHI